MEKPWIMGVLNVAPDSFFDGGHHLELSKALSKVQKMLEEGADIIDVGAMSSRPYSMEVPEEEELNRLKNILPELIRSFPDSIFSIDTFRSGIAQYAVDCGVAVLNDISSGRRDERMLDIAKEYGCPYISMHMRGTPQNMQDNPSYENILLDIGRFFADRIERYIQKGLNDIIIDPGFGFGKTLEDNFILLKNLNYFTRFHLPVMVGLSRKSMICKTLNISPGDALNGTTAMHWEALRQGANILRVHDVKEACEVVSLFRSYDKV